MHLRLDRSGHITHAGPTLIKLRGREALIGQRFLEVFDLQRPVRATTINELRAMAGRKLHMVFRDPPCTGLKGALCPMGDDLVVNMSFGISVLDAVRDYELTHADFAPTDLTVEMLYLIEAKSAAMESSRRLNMRLQGARIAAEEQAFSDMLTGLRNRRAMDHVLDRLIAADREFALMHLDLDFFKAVNDTLGHAAGDMVLQQVASILVAEVRQNDVVARIGGDEFVLIFKDQLNQDVLDRIATRIIARLEEPVAYKEQMCRISASIGTTLSSFYPRPDADQMLADADLALYQSKHEGRARHTFFDPQVDLPLRTNG